jgi:hypothetical protein
MITFVVSKKFSENAKLLDKKRLWKQVLEANQILERLTNLYLLATILSIDIPTASSSYQKKHKFIRKVMCLINRKTYIPVWTTEDKTSFEYIPKYDKHKVNTQLHIKLGYVYHPIILMWMGYETALKLYIYEHHKEWIHRGCKYKCELEKLNSNIIYYPWWINVLIPYHQRILATKNPSEYKQWNKLEPLYQLPWNEFTK